MDCLASLIRMVWVISGSPRPDSHSVFVVSAGSPVGVTVHSEVRGDRHSFPGQTMNEWFGGFGRSSLCRGKNEPVPEL
jgi:hypothetical protein